MRKGDISKRERERDAAFAKKARRKKGKKPDPVQTGRDEREKERYSTRTKEQFVKKGVDDPSENDNMEWFLFRQGDGPARFVTVEDPEWLEWQLAEFRFRDDLFDWYLEQEQQREVEEYYRRQDEECRRQQEDDLKFYRDQDEECRRQEEDSGWCEVYDPPTTRSELKEEELLKKIAETTRRRQQLELESQRLDDDLEALRDELDMVRRGFW